MRALSIQQPWAHAIVHLARDVDHRAWASPTLIGERIAIHASASAPRANYDAYYELVDESPKLVRARTLPDELPLSAILGTIKIAGVIDAQGRAFGNAYPTETAWYAGGPAFFFDPCSVIAFAEPLYDVRGRLGFWPVSDELEEKVHVLEKKFAKRI